MQQCSSRDEDMCGSPEVAIVALHQIFGGESLPHILCQPDNAIFAFGAFI